MKYIESRSGRSRVAGDFQEEWMQAVSHMLVGTTLYVGYVVTTGRPLSILELAVATASSLLPDIDHPKSAFGRVVPFLSIPLSAIFGHRGITHSLLAVAAMAVAGAMYFNTPGFAMAVIIGYLSHLLADAFSNSGVPLLWPSKRKFAIPIIKTGGIVEYLLMAALAFYLVSFMVGHIRSLAW